MQTMAGTIDLTAFKFIYKCIKLIVVHTDTSQTQSVADGQTITWRITDSFTSDDYTNMSVETQSGATADCDPETNLSTSFSACSAGAKTSTLSIQNTESATAYYKVEYQIDSGSFTNYKCQLIC